MDVVFPVACVAFKKVASTFGYVLTLASANGSNSGTFFDTPVSQRQPDASANPLTPSQVVHTIFEEPIGPLPTSLTLWLGP